jgi:hypothetical protein
MNNDDFNSDNIILIWCDPKIKGSKIELNIISKIIINNSTKIISNNFIEDFSINEAEYLDDIITNLGRQYLQSLGKFNCSLKKFTVTQISI